METLIIHSEHHKIEGLKAFLKAFDIKFEIKNDSPYDKEFVEKIRESEEDYKAGRYKTIKTADLWK